MKSMKDSNTKMKEKINWRRNKVSELSIKGFSQAEIARILQISEATVSRDIEYLKELANENIRNHIQKTLPYQYSKCISGLDEIIKGAWIVATKANKNENSKEYLSSLALIKDTYSEKMNLLTNASLLQDSIKFVTGTKQNLSNKKENIDQSIDIQGSTEDNTDTESNQYNQVF
ncbi:MAG TPA: HTH domain-containing protein [Nitrososphaeraceae archaeon]|nr:HTH domain-containing protein [Nitrososphaeraceae archaeon]